MAGCAALLVKAGAGSSQAAQADVSAAAPQRNPHREVAPSVAARATRW